MFIKFDWNALQNVHIAVLNSLKTKTIIQLPCQNLFQDYCQNFSDAEIHKLSDSNRGK